MNKIVKPKKINENIARVTAMLIGDGSLPIKHNGEGKRNYLLYFCNTDYSLVNKFSTIIENEFKISGRISERQRKNRKIIYEYNKYSKEICEYFNNEMQVPYGEKSNKVIVPEKIKRSNKKIKNAFLWGLIETDGGIKREKGLIFHCASRKLLEDVSTLVNEIYKINKKEVKEYKQNEFKSYQLTFTKHETENILKLG